MKRIVLPLVFILLFLLSSCGTGADTATTTAETDETSKSAVTEPTRKGKPANDSIDTKTEIDGITVRDMSVLYRTEDSYVFENAAFSSALSSFRGSVSMPDTLKVLNASVFNCADNGEAVFYSFSLKGTYTVESGEQITSGYSCDVGVQKSDSLAFDASEQIDDVVDAYSLFVLPEDDDKPAVQSGVDPVESAEQIAVSRLKNKEQATVVSSEIVAEFSDTLQIEVLCRGVNDYGMEIPDIYTVYLRKTGDSFAEAEPDAS
ncbi:MAG: hypothetical protein IJT44_11350 [Clostridia bacterium]|nr:hypothetical protein [Clostridia bacterium]